MDFNKSLSSENIRLEIMTRGDFDRLYNIAKDPEIWAQHNDKSRSQVDGFKKYFDDGLKNPQNCYLIFHNKELVGSTRYYEYDCIKKSIKIGYTFYAKEYWGTELNKKVKKLMLDYAFESVENVLFDVWYKNIRSQKAVSKLGAKLCENDTSRERLVFILNKKDWENLRNN
ncbi:MULTISPECIES: GNAT family N-acetyltransferase [Francisella]|uniref:GNAT family N-acetyltransferase n=1 Tax=Francisella TaxID=262 RepID=UPI0011B82B5A|nr:MULTISPECIES: GNAT family N-acetyltransferase [Francisella]